MTTRVVPDDPVDVVLVDDHPLFTEGLELLLGEAGDGRVRVVGRTGNAAMAVDLVRRTAPDVALVDLAMPPPGGRDAIRAVKRAAPGVRVLVLSGTTDQAEVVAALRDGADGFLPKSAEPAELVPPLLAAAAGWTVLPGGFADTLARAAARPGAALREALDDAERDLWLLVATGAGTDVIAQRLIVSERTAKRMVAGLLRRIGARNRIEAAALAGRCGLHDEPDA